MYLCLVATSGAQVIRSLRKGAAEPKGRAAQPVKTAPFRGEGEDHLRRRAIISAAAPRPVSASVDGSGTTVTPQPTCTLYRLSPSP